MKVFFSDLDNTLIYSHRRKINDPKIPVEYLEGKEQSFITNGTFDFLCNLRELTLVPVSTRTEEQYRRLNCMKRIKVKYAIVCNGGKLLVDGKVDEQWEKETYDIADPFTLSMKKAAYELEKICNRNIHRPERYMCYATTNSSESVCKELAKRIDTDSISALYDNRKVYIFPKVINKGIATGRFAERFEVDYSIAAGDSIMDVSMLNTADYALAAEGIYDLVSTEKKEKLIGCEISQSICTVIRAWQDKEFKL